MAIIEAVLWDMDGVLIDSERLVRDIFVEVMADSGIKGDLTEFYNFTIGMNRKSIHELYLKHLGSAERAEYYFDLINQHYMQRLEQDLVLKPGVHAALQAINAEELPQMVVTSTQTEKARFKLQHFDLLDYFSELVGGDQVSNGKPSPEPYLLGCEKLGIDPHRALVIEDSPNGVKAGLAAGCMVMHVPDLIPTDPHWQHDIYASLETLEEFPDWLVQQRGGDWL